MGGGTCQKRSLKNLFGQLKPFDKKVFTLRYIDKMKHKDIAKKVQSTENAIAVRVFRIAHQIKECLKKIGFD